MIEDKFVHYTANISGMDNDHLTMLKDIEHLLEEMDVEQANITVDRVSDLWAHHAKREEAFMESIGYPYLKGHQREHEVRIAEFQNMKDRIHKQVAHAGKQHTISEFMYTLLYHIDNWDLQIAKYYHSKPELQHIGWPHNAND